MYRLYRVEKHGEHNDVVDAFGNFVSSADTISEANADIARMLGKEDYAAGRKRDSS